MKEKKWQYRLQASFLEIYNEEIRDLLAVEKDLKYEIKMTDNKGTDLQVSTCNHAYFPCILDHTPCILDLCTHAPFR